MTQLGRTQQGSGGADIALVGEDTCSKPGSARRVSVARGSRTISAPSSGVNVRTGETVPAREPRNTRSTAPSRRTGSGT